MRFFQPNSMLRSLLFFSLIGPFEAATQVGAFDDTRSAVLSNGVTAEEALERRGSGGVRIGDQAQVSSITTKKMGDQAAKGESSRPDKPEIENQEEWVGFVNDYGTEEDIEKYKLREIWDRYYPRHRGKYFYGRKPELTIDRSRDIFLILKETAVVERFTRFFFILGLRGEVVLADLELVTGSSGNLKDRPFLRVWDLKRLDNNGAKSVSKEEVIAELKRAMKAFGYRGARQQIPQTKVLFKF